MREKWYPGHMVKARRTVHENLKNVDVVIEVRDARLPNSSGNPDLPNILKGKPYVVALNKKDLANNEMTQRWIQHLQNQGILAVAVSASKGHGVKELISLLKKATAERYARMDLRGRRARALHVMIVGIPNVGKSQLINALAQKSAAKTGDRPGVTRGKQWIHIDERFLLLDTPGILWPLQRDPQVQQKMDLIAAIDSKSGDPETIVLDLMAILKERELEMVCSYFNLTEVVKEPQAILEAVARVRGLLAAGGLADKGKAAVHILRAFQTGNIGRLTFEEPGEESDDGHGEDVNDDYPEHD